jgi:hypothetical protein
LFLFSLTKRRLRGLELADGTGWKPMLLCLPEGRDMFQRVAT